MTELILASGSPRRARLLKEIAGSFRIVPSEIVEEQQAGETPEAFVLRVAREKAESVAKALDHGDGACWVLAGDTIVVLEQRVLGKPEDAERARSMLALLQGRQHEVITGICLLNTVRAVRCVEAVRTRVWMKEIGPAELEAYVQTGEPLDKAGAYAIQGHAGRFVRRIEGSYSNVVGLPTERLRELFLTYGIR